VARPRFALVPELTLDAIAAHHEDVVAALRLYFSPASPTYIRRFAGRLIDEITSELESRLLEEDVRSMLAVLTSLEAHFRADFNLRCRQRLKDDLSRHFRQIERARGDRVRLDEDILEGWGTYASATPISIGVLIGRLRGALKLRHWLAHGRYWSRKPGSHQNDFYSILVLAEQVIQGFQFKLD
jgi:hypothetical protein